MKRLTLRLRLSSPVIAMALNPSVGFTTSDSTCIVASIVGTELFNRLSRLTSFSVLSVAVMTLFLTLPVWAAAL